jgi:general secretion pathway protein G
MRKAIDEYYADKQKYPPSLDSLVAEKYLREIKPDPFTQTVDSWQTTMSEPDAANPSAETGIWNVKSGATGTGSDGHPYSEW